MGLFKKWNVVLHKEMGDVVVASLKSKKEAEDFIHQRKGLTQHLVGNKDIYTVECDK
jgi:hypothetical protein